MKSTVRYCVVLTIIMVLVVSLMLIISNSWWFALGSVAAAYIITESLTWVGTGGYRNTARGMSTRAVFATNCVFIVALMILCLVATLLGPIGIILTAWVAYTWGKQ